MRLCGGEGEGVRGNDMGKGGGGVCAEVQAAGGMRLPEGPGERVLGWISSEQDEASEVISVTSKVGELGAWGGGGGQPEEQLPQGAINIATTASAGPGCRNTLCMVSLACYCMF